MMDVSTIVAERVSLTPISLLEVWAVASSLLTRVRGTAIVKACGAGSSGSQKCKRVAFCVKARLALSSSASSSPTFSAWLLVWV